MNDWLSVAPGRKPRRAAGPATEDRDRRARQLRPTPRPVPPTGPRTPLPIPGPVVAPETVVAVCGSCYGTGLGDQSAPTWTGPAGWTSCRTCLGTGRVRVQLARPTLPLRPWWSTSTNDAVIGRR